MKSLRQGSSNTPCIIDLLFVNLRYESKTGSGVLTRPYIFYTLAKFYTCMWLDPLLLLYTFCCHVTWWLVVSDCDWRECDSVTGSQVTAETVARAGCSSRHTNYWGSRPWGSIYIFLVPIGIALPVSWVDVQVVVGFMTMSCSNVVFIGGWRRVCVSRNVLLRFRDSGLFEPHSTIVAMWNFPTLRCFIWLWLLKSPFMFLMTFPTFSVKNLGIDVFLKKKRMAFPTLPRRVFITDSIVSATAQIVHGARASSPVVQSNGAFVQIAGH